jgi:hypothetical protein
MVDQSISVLNPLLNYCKVQLEKNTLKYVGHYVRIVIQGFIMFDEICWVLLYPMRLFLSMSYIF